MNNNSVLTWLTFKMTPDLIFYRFQSTFKDLYLSDDSPVLPDPAVLLLKPYVVKQGQRQGLSIAAQDGLALAHISSCEGEAAAGVGGVMTNVTQSR